MRAHRWRDMLESGGYATVRDLAKAETMNESYLGRVLRLTLLAPKIVETILEGRQPPTSSSASFSSNSRSNGTRDADRELNLVHPSAAYQRGLLHREAEPRRRRRENVTLVYLVRSEEFQF